MIVQMFKKLALALMLMLSPAMAQTVQTDFHQPLITQAEGKADFQHIQAADGSVVASGPKYQVVITGDLGGSVVEYIQKYNKLRQDGSRVRIDDLCMSACTLITGLVPDPAVCVSPYAIMAFHSAWFMTPFGPQFSPEGTRLLWNIYPEKVREKLKANGWDGSEHPDFIYFKGTDFYPLCD